MILRQEDDTSFTQSETTQTETADDKIARLEARIEELDARIRFLEGGSPRKEARKPMKIEEIPDTAAPASLPDGWREENDANNCYIIVNEEKTKFLVNDFTDQNHRKTADLAVARRVRDSIKHANIYGAPPNRDASEMIAHEAGSVQEFQVKTAV